MTRPGAIEGPMLLAGKFAAHLAPGAARLTRAPRPAHGPPSLAPHTNHRTPQVVVEPSRGPRGGAVARVCVLPAAGPLPACGRDPLRRQPRLWRAWFLEQLAPEGVMRPQGQAGVPATRSDHAGATGPATARAACLRPPVPASTSWGCSCPCSLKATGRKIRCTFWRFSRALLLLTSVLAC